MSKAIEELISTEWNSYEVPETGVIGDFPAEPVVEAEDEEEDGAVTTTLSVDGECDGAAYRLDLAVSVDQSFDVPSSEALASHLREQLDTDEQLELLSVEPRPYDECPGVLQRLRLRESGEQLLQWLISTPTDTVYVGVTFTNDRLEPVAKKFLDSIAVTTSGASEQQ